ncbi:MAG TPA: hypothetical protein VGC89_17405, partial [Pyrinomonadaceae bacterium]
MKRCPTCQRSYTDDSLTFCLEDGAPLKHEPAPGSSSEPPATMILKEPPPTSSNRNAAPTEMYNATPTQGASAPGYTPPPPRPSWTPQPPAPQAQPFGQSSWAATSAGAAAAPPNKFLLAIFGGILMAVPSLIPLIQFGCCLWAAGGGLLAAGLYIRKSPAKVEMGEGAILGAIAGGIGGLINLGIGLPVTYNLYGPEGPLHTKDGDLGGTMVVVGIFGSLMLVAFSIAGG